MTNFILITIAIYILYYAGNIVYDLFIAKEKKLATEEDKEEFSLENLADADEVNITQVDLDSVEEITSSNSIEIAEDEIFFGEENETIEFDTEKPVENKREHIKEAQRKRFRDILNQAETSVQVVLSADGEKLFQSTIPSV